MNDQKSFVAYTYTLENVTAKRRKRLKFWALISISLILLLILFSLFSWRVAPSPKWRTLVMDKTVPHTDYREHRALFWMLNHMKVMNKEGEKRWRLDKDYLGFYPEKFVSTDASYSSDLELDHIVGLDLLFIVDTYGVYVDDYKFPEGNRTHLDYSKNIFGGLSKKDVDIIQDFVQKGGSLVAEFNTLNHPTEKREKGRMEQLLGLRTSGWIGRYFVDLSNKNDVPSWAFRNWQAQHDEEWSFTGPGFIIAHPDTRLLVLEEGQDVAFQGLRIEIAAADDPLMKAVAPKVPYPYWFDIVTVGNDEEVLARYRFQLTPEGKKKMEDFSIPATFPAVIRASRSPLHLYFAGDFSDSDIDPGPYFFHGWTRIRRILCSLKGNKIQDRFFWSFYVPLLKNLFSQVKQ